MLQQIQAVSLLNERDVVVVGVEGSERLLDGVVFGFDFTNEGDFPLIKITSSVEDAGEYAGRVLANGEYNAVYR